MGELLLSTIVVSVNDKLIGIQLKKARLEKGLSQEEAGNSLGVTWEMISRYENGRTSPMKHLRRLADLYEKPVAYFITSAEDVDSFDINKLVSKLKDEGIGYNKAFKNVIKVLEKLTGKGIEEDIVSSENYFEVGTTLTEKYPNLFALKLGQIDMLPDVDLRRDEIGLFARGVDAQENDIVLGYDGITYKVMNYNSDSLDTPLAVLVATERRFRQ